MIWIANQIECFYGTFLDPDRELDCDLDNSARCKQGIIKCVHSFMDKWLVDCVLRPIDSEVI